MCRVNRPFGWVSLLALVILSVSAGRAVAAEILQVNLSPGQADGSLVFELANRGTVPLSVLTTNTPLEPLLGDDVFDIRRPSSNGRIFTRPAWVGPHVRRLPPSWEDFLVLQPGETVSADVDLHSLYAFAAAADYMISYRGKLTIAATPPDAAATRLRSGASLMSVTPQSNTLELSLGRSPPSARARPAAYNACSSSQESLLVEATEAAEQIAGEALQSLNAVPAAERAAARRYTEWFGPYSASRYQSVTDGYTRLYESLQDASLSYDCSCDRANVYAYVFPVVLHEIYLCPVFWQTDLSGTDSRAGTLVHELSHFTALVGTDDHAYGQRAARELAQNDPTTAIDNADNFGYFAENDPVLPMSGGAAPTVTTPDSTSLPTPTTAVSLVVGTPVSRRIARNEIHAFDISGAGRVTVTPISGDPDLYVYDDPGRNSDSLICSSRQPTEEVDSCALESGREHYVSVLGYDDARYEIVATGADAPPMPDSGVAGAQVMEDGTPIESVVAEDEIAVFSVTAPARIVLTSLSGDADLEVYASASLTTPERICQSGLVTPVDVCEISGSGTAYVVVIGYTAAVFSLETQSSSVSPSGPVDDDPSVPSSGVDGNDGNDGNDADDGLFGGGGSLGWPVLSLAIFVFCGRRHGRRPS